VTVAPVDAATVIVVRTSDGTGSPWETYMIRRPVRSDFAADVYVFPGGKVDAEDYDFPVACEVSPIGAEPATVLSEMERALRVAAARELFEEIGIVLTNDSVTKGEWDSTKFDAWRHNLIAGRMSFGEVVRQLGVRIDLRQIHPFSRWVTPRAFPRRYDTRFYVAYLPPGQKPAPHASEAPEGLWIAPKEALARYQSGQFPLVFATECHLLRMARYATVESMVASVTRDDLVPVTPQVVADGGETRFLLPDDPGYTED